MRADVQRRSSSRGEYAYVVKKNDKTACYAFALFTRIQNRIMTGGSGSSGDEMIFGRCCLNKGDPAALAGQMHEAIEGLRLRGLGREGVVVSKQRGHQNFGDRICWKAMLWGDAQF